MGIQNTNYDSPFIIIIITSWAMLIIPADSNISRALRDVSIISFNLKINNLLRMNILKSKNVHGLLLHPKQLIHNVQVHVPVHVSSICMLFSKKWHHNQPQFFIAFSDTCIGIMYAESLR